MKYQHSEVLKFLNIVDEEAFESEEETASNKLFAGTQGNLSSRFSSCLFFTIYSASKNVAVSRWWAIFIMIYQTLQLLALAFVPDPNTTPVSTFTWLKTQLDFVTFRSITTASSSTLQISFWAVVLAIVCTYSFGLWVGKQFWFASPTSSPIATLLLRYLLHLETTILFLPFITVITSSVNCTTGITACDGSAGQYLFVTGVFLLLISFIALMTIVSLISIDNNPLALDVRAAPHGRVNAAACAIVAFTNTLNTLIENDNVVIQIVTVLSSGVVITFVYIQYLPHYRQFYNRFNSSLYAVTAWAGFCLLISYVINDTTRNLFVGCLLMGLPLIFFGSFLFVIVREASLGQLEVERGMSVYMCELILRCKWQESAYGSKTQAYRKIVDEIYSENAYMLLQLSTIYFASGSASLLAGQYLSKANRCRIKSFDSRFYIFRAFRKLHQEKSGESGALNFMTLKHHQMNAESNILDALNHIQNLFDALLGGTLTPSELFLIANKVDRASERAKENLVMLIKLTKSAPRTLLLYSLYASEILFDFGLSKRLHKAAHEAFRQNGMSDQSNLEEVTIVISGNEASIGVVLDCSDNVENVYGHSPSNVIGKNIDALCPPPVNKGVHERFLRHYIETATSFIPIVKTVWVQHAEGYSVRCSLNIAPVQDSETGSLTFQGKLTKLQQDTDFVGIRQTGEILFYSAGMLKSFGLRSFFEKGNGQEVKIQNAIPAMANIDFAGLHGKLANNSNYSETAVIETDPGESYKISMYPKSFPQAGIFFTVIDVKLIENDIAVESESEAADSENDSFDEEVEDVFDRKQSTHSLEESIKSGRPDDETSSAKSDSRSTIRATSKMRAAIRNNIISDKKRFREFRRLSIMFAITFIALTVTSIVVNHVVFANVSLSIDTFHQSGGRVSRLLEAGTAFLTMIKGGNLSDFDTSLIRETISLNANEIEASHETIIHMGASQTALIENLLYNSSLLSEYHSDHSSSTTSFNSLILSLVANMRAFLNTGDMICGDACEFVVNNVQWDVVDIALEMIAQYKIDVEQTFVSVKYINMSLVIFSSLVVVLVLLVFITPRLLEVKRVKDDVSMSVGSIQNNTLRRVCAFNSHRIQKVSMMMEHINKAPNPFQIDTSKFGKEVRVGKSMLNMRKQMSASEGHTPITKWLWCCCRKYKKTTVVYPSPTGGSENEKGTGERVNFKEGGLSSSLVTSFVKMTIPLAMIALFFGVIYLVNNNLKEDAMLFINSLNANVMRQVDFQKLTFSSHAPMINPPIWTRWSADPTLYNVTRTVSRLLDSITSSTNMIQYGNDAGEGSPFINKANTPYLYDLYYVDACSPVPSCVHAQETIPDYPVIKSMESGLRVMIDGIVSRTQAFLVNSSIEIISFPASFPLADANDLAVSYFQKNLLNHVNAVQGGLLALSLIAMIAFVFIFAFLIRVFRGINNELVDAQSLFLLLPGDVLDSIPELNRILGLVDA